MGMAQSLIRWTADLLESLPDDGNRYEVIDGELFVTPAPSRSHQTVVLELAVLLREYSRALGMQVLVAPFAVKFSREREVQPDILVVPAAGGDASIAFDSPGVLHLVIEVLSRTTSWRDRGIKRRLYQEQGVPEYWIIDARERTVERWRTKETAAEVFTDTLSWQPVAGADPLTIDLAALFRTVHGE
jgi:Uma2 family endonuclease